MDSWESECTYGPDIEVSFQRWTRAFNWLLNAWDFMILHGFKVTLYYKGMLDVYWALKRRLHWCRCGIGFRQLRLKCLELKAVMWFLHSNGNMGGWVCIVCKVVYTSGIYKKLGHFLLCWRFFDCNQAILSLGEDVADLLFSGSNLNSIRGVYTLHNFRAFFHYIRPGFVADIWEQIRYWVKWSDVSISNLFHLKPWWR
jgi:hypothetical protein